MGLGGLSAGLSAGTAAAPSAAAAPPLPALLLGPNSSRGGRWACWLNAVVPQASEAGGRVMQGSAAALHVFGPLIMSSIGWL